MSATFSESTAVLSKLCCIKRKCAMLSKMMGHCATFSESVAILSELFRNR